MLVHDLLMETILNIKVENQILHHFALIVMHNPSFYRCHTKIVCEPFIIFTFDLVFFVLKTKHNFKKEGNLFLF